MATESPHWHIMRKMMSPPFFVFFFFYPILFILESNETSPNFGQIGPLTAELAALDRLNISHRLIMGKWCLLTSSFIFDRIIIKVAVTRKGIKARASSISGLWFPWPIYILLFFLNEIWPWHTGLRWAIVALWATCLNNLLVRFSRTASNWPWSTS